MTRPSKPAPGRLDINEAIMQSAAAFKALTHEQQREIHAIQRKSWVLGELMLNHPNMSREEAEAIYERAGR